MFCRIELAGLPRGKANPYMVAGKNGGLPHVIVNPESRKYMNNLGWAAQQAMAGRLPTALPVRIIVSAFLAVPQSWSKKKRLAALSGNLWPTVKPDWDNIGKQCDALKGIVWIDDKQVVNAQVFKCYAEQPGLLIEVEEIWPGAYRDWPDTVQTSLPTGPDGA